MFPSCSFVKYIARWLKPRQGHGPGGKRTNNIFETRYVYDIFPWYPHVIVLLYRMFSLFYMVYPIFVGELVTKHRKNHPKKSPTGITGLLDILLIQGQRHILRDDFLVEPTMMDWDGKFSK